MNHLPVNPGNVGGLFIDLNTITAGAMMLIMNIAGNQIVNDLTPYQREVLQNPWFRRLAMFALFFMATRNLWIAFGLTFVSVIFLQVFLNETSRYYLFKRTGQYGETRGIGTQAYEMFQGFQSK
jgi:hypothetical protein